jgi:hypothetical protein
MNILTTLFYNFYLKNILPVSFIEALELVLIDLLPSFGKYKSPDLPHDIVHDNSNIINILYKLLRYRFFLFIISRNFKDYVL